MEHSWLLLGKQMQAAKASCTCSVSIANFLSSAADAALSVVFMNQCDVSRVSCTDSTCSYAATVTCDQSLI